MVLATTRCLDFLLQCSSKKVRGGVWTKTFLGYRVVKKPRRRVVFLALGPKKLDPSNDINDPPLWENKCIKLVKGVQFRLNPLFMSLEMVHFVGWWENLPLLHILIFFYQFEGFCKQNYSRFLSNSGLSCFIIHLWPLDIYDTKLLK